MNLNDSRTHSEYNVLQNPKKELKILIIGDCMVGKTCLFINYFKNIGNPNLLDNDMNNNTRHSDCIHNDIDCRPFSSYSPTTLSVYRCDIKINAADYSLSLTDTSGCRSNEKFVALRRHYYSFTKDIDAIIMCFSLVDPVSFSNISKKWYPEVREFYPEVPMLLVGTKLDIKHQIKYQKQKKTMNSTAEESLILPKLIGLEPSSNHIQPTTDQDLLGRDSINRISISIENTAALVNNKLAAKAENKQTKKLCFTKCNYCSGIQDQKSRSSKGSFLSNLTARALADGKTRAVSIVSKVSQQHTTLNASDSYENNLIVEKAKSLANIHESNTNLISILKDPIYPNESSQHPQPQPQQQNENDDEENQYGIDEYGMNDNDWEDHCDSDFFKNLELYNENCLCVKYIENDLNSYDECDESSDINRIASIMSSTNLNESKVNVYDLQNNLSSVGSTKTVLIDDDLSMAEKELKVNTTIDDLTRTADSSILKYDDDSEKQVKRKQLLKKPSELSIKRKECLKLKQSMHAKKYLECSCIDDTSVKIVMDTAIGLALEYHLKQNQLVKNTSIVSKTSTQTNKSGSLFNKYSLIGSLKKDNSSSNVLGTMNSTHSSKEYNLFSLKKKLLQSEKSYRDYKSCDEEASTAPLHSETPKIERKSSIKSKEIISNEIALKVLDAERRGRSDEPKLISQKRKSKYSVKSDRQLSLRCLSCTRAQNDTNTSLNQI